MQKLKKREPKKQRANYWATDKHGTTFRCKTIELKHMVETEKERIEVIANNPNYIHIWQWTEQEARDLIIALEKFLPKEYKTFEEKLTKLFEDSGREVKEIEVKEGATIYTIRVKEKK